MLTLRLRQSEMTQSSAPPNNGTFHPRRWRGPCCSTSSMSNTPHNRRTVAQADPLAGLTSSTAGCTLGCVGRSMRSCGSKSLSIASTSTLSPRSGRQRSGTGERTRSRNGSVADRRRRDPEPATGARTKGGQEPNAPGPARRQRRRSGRAVTGTGRALGDTEPAGGVRATVVCAGRPGRQ